MEVKKMFETKWGIEIEFTGISKKEASEILAEALNTTVRNSYSVKDSKNRIWKIVGDGSIRCEKKQNGNIVPAGSEYSCELVSPILSYRQDIETLQELIRKLRKAGAFTNNSCGIHIHLDGKPYKNDTQRIRNFINIIASKNDLFYDALAIEPNRARYCKKLDEYLVKRMNQVKPKSLKQLEDIWYEGYRSENRNSRYHGSRYHFLNLHSLFRGVGTVELRGFNSELHAGKIRAYVILALALGNQAVTQRCASSKKNQAENPKFAMRTYLNRIGLIGDEFKNCRTHLTNNLSGSSAWRLGSREATPRRGAA
jgi:hypothetical protein